MSAANVDDRVAAGISAWQRGDLSALEPLLDENVELLWWEPDVGACHGREAVLKRLRHRFAEAAEQGEIDVLRSDGDTLVVSHRICDPPRPDGTQPATVVTSQGGLVISMRQYRTREEALAATSRG
ncbi:MAG: nuclear transport factor 2 family protein [Candidatus Dormibacteria bacterium]